MIRITAAVCAAALAGVPALAQQDPTVGGPDQLSAPGVMTGPGVGFDRPPDAVGGMGRVDGDREAAVKEQSVLDPDDEQEPDLAEDSATLPPGGRLPGGSASGTESAIGGEAAALGRAGGQPPSAPTLGTGDHGAGSVDLGGRR